MDRHSRQCVIPSVRRTLQLMRCGRWPVLGFYCLISISTDAVLRLPALTSGDTAPGLSSAVGDSSQLIWGVILAMCYRELVPARDGAAPGDIAETFA